MPKKKFRLFDMNRDGPGVEKSEKPEKMNFWSLPKIYFRKFTKLLSVNFAMLPILIIPLAMLYIYVTAPTTPTMSHPAYSTLYGSYMLTRNPAWTSLLGIYGIQLNMPVFNAWRIWLVIGLVVLLACLWGWINVGAAYCCRSLYRGEPVFIIDDFKYSIKKNLKQGFFVGLLDFACIGILAFDVFYFSRRGGDFMTDFMFYSICAITFVYMFARMYFYVLLITFDIKTGKLLKNSLIFALLGIKNNLFAFIYVVLIIALNAALIVLLWSVPLIGPVFIILPFIYLLPTVCFFNMYFSYPVVKKYMID